MDQQAGQHLSPDVRRAVVRWILESVAGWAEYAALLLLSAGRWSWVWG